MKVKWFYQKVSRKIPGPRSCHVWHDSGPPLTLTNRATRSLKLCRNYLNWNKAGSTLLPLFPNSYSYVSGVGCSFYWISRSTNPGTVQLGLANLNQHFVGKHNKDYFAVNSHAAMFAVSRTLFLVI